MPKHIPVHNIDVTAILLDGFFYSTMRLLKRRKKRGMMKPKEAKAMDLKKTGEILARLRKEKNMFIENSLFPDSHSSFIAQQQFHKQHFP